MLPATIKVGDQVEVTQTIVGRDHQWDTTVRGTVAALEDQPTGAWFAHGRHGHLWLSRICLRKDDGEMTTLILEPATRIRRLNNAHASSPSTPEPAAR